MSLPRSLDDVAPDDAAVARAPVTRALPPGGAHPWRLVVVGYAAALLVGLGCAWLMQHGPDWNEGFRWEHVLLLWVRAHPLPRAVEDVLWAVPWVATNLTLYPVAVLASLWIGLRHRRWRVVAWLMTVATGCLTLNALLKHLTRRERPDLWERIGWYGWASYPSGHAIMAVAVLGTVALALVHWRRWRWAPWAATALAMLVLYSRMYHGVHWPTDLLGGAAVGAVWLWVTWVALGRDALHD